ncbi:MAG: hypothetical protein KatS3mg115_2131 [Candidatus Poribacteria bacterium]|nr:MAG: hypothetical protein KatS3mg115_2131 [Candidatus Poribacteria bacterium]
MRRLRSKDRWSASWALVGLGLLLALGGGCRRSAPEATVWERSYRFLPVDTAVLLAVRVNAFADTEAFAQAERRLLETPGVGPALRESGKTLREAVDWVFVAVSAEGISSEEIAPLGLVHTTLGEGFLGRAFQGSERPPRSVEVGAVRMWLMDQDGDRLAVAEVDQEFWALGPETEVRRAAERAQGHASSLRKESRLFQGVESFPEEAAFWAVFDVTPSVPATLNRAAPLSGIESVHHLVGSGTVDESGVLQIALDAYCQTPEDAQALEGSLRTLVGLAGLTPPENPAFQQLLESLTLQAVGARLQVRFSVGARPVADSFRSLISGE